MPPPFLYHTTPLQYLPHILQSGALYAQSVLAARGIAPRTGAARRDKMLGLVDYVHLSLHPHSPLLADKLARGYPHVLLIFPADPILALPDTALLPYNTKAWRTKSAYAPVTDRVEQARLLRHHVEAGRYPSLEVLVKYGLDLALLAQVAFLTETERETMEHLLSGLGLAASAPSGAEPSLFPLRGAYAPVTLNAIDAYFRCCLEAGTLLPPPPVPFD